MPACLSVCLSLIVAVVVVVTAARDHLTTTSARCELLSNLVRNLWTKRTCLISQKSSIETIEILFNFPHRAAITHRRQDSLPPWFVHLKIACLARERVVYNCFSNFWPQTKATLTCLAPHNFWLVNAMSNSNGIELICSFSKTTNQPASQPTDRPRFYFRANR